MNMDTCIPTKDQYDSFVTYFTNYLVKVLNIRSRNDFFYLTEMRKLNALFGSRISNCRTGRTLRLQGGSKKDSSKTKTAKTVRQILKDRHDRQPSSITYKVMGYSISPDNIDTIILLAMAVAGGAIMLAIDPHSLDHRATLRASALGVGGTYALFAAFGFLWCFYITANYKISKAAKEVAWIRKIVETMTQVETKSSVDPMTMMMMMTTQVTQQTRYAPSLFPTYNRYTQIMQAIIRESMQMHHRDDGVDKKRLCILSTACLAGILARTLLQPLQPRLNKKNSRMSGNIIGRLGTIHRVLKMLDNAAKSRTSYTVLETRKADPANAAAMFPFLNNDTKGVTKGTSS
jgi:hypothetical protein